jgi:hypothetical protein
MKGKLERQKATQEEVDKLTELGRKFKNISKEWETAKDKKPILQKITKTLSAERLKKLECIVCCGDWLFIAFNVGF